MKRIYENRQSIELRSEEFQEVLGRMPSWMLRWGMGLLAVVVVLLLAGSALFSYPDTVSTAFTLTTQAPPAYLPSKTGGRIERLYVRNGQAVKRGDCLATLESTARTEDVLYLHERLKAWKREGARPELADRLLTRSLPRLGEVQGAYSSCLTAWDNYLQHMGENRSYETQLLNAVALLDAALAEWESTYLLTAPTDGTVAFMQLWKENQLTTAGETMFVVVPQRESAPVGKASLPMQGSGKVRVGQRVVVRLDAFPEQEFGFLEGLVESISPVPDEEGNFVVEVALPHGLKTHYGKELPVMKVMSGTADIVTKERSLLQRILKIKR